MYTSIKTTYIFALSIKTKTKKHTMKNTTQTILEQLGGNKFIAMTGAACYSDGENKLVVKFKGSKIANYLTIELNSMDTYSLVFSKLTPSKFLPVKTYSFVYNDMLQDIFTKVTGLYTSL